MSEDQRVGSCETLYAQLESSQIFLSFEEYEDSVDRLDSDCEMVCRWDEDDR